MSGDLTVRVDSDCDDDELLNLTHDLRLELLELDIDVVRPRPAPPVPDAQGTATVSGRLVVSLDGGPSLRSVVGAVRAWAARNRSDVEVSLGDDVLTVSGAAGAAGAEREQAIEDWLAQHSPGA
jgi:hypothetical protein